MNKRQRKKAAKKECYLFGEFCRDAAEAFKAFDGWSPLMTLTHQMRERNPEATITQRVFIVR